MNRNVHSDSAKTNRLIASLIAVLTFALSWWLWASWSPQAAGSDESAYLLQARVFAS